MSLKAGTALARIGLLTLSTLYTLAFAQDVKTNYMPGTDFPNTTHTSGF